METDGVELKNKSSEGTSSTCLRIQNPKRILHFSDGIMEEFSDNEDEFDSITNTEYIDPKHLPWGPYMRFKANKVGSNVLAGIDYIGGGLASFFGITTSEADFTAANRRITEEDNTEEEICGTWRPTESGTVVSEEVVSSSRPNRENN